MLISRKSKRVAKRLRIFLALAVMVGAVCLASGLAISGMSLMDEDSLADVQAQSGLSLVARVRTTSGNMRITGTGYLDLNGVTINNSASGGFGRIGDYDDPARLDIGRSGTSIRMQLQFPNGMNGATELNEVPSIQASNVTWTNSAGTGVDVGTLGINQIYQNQMRLTAWFHTSGLNLLAELNGDITEIYTYKGTGRGASLQNTMFSATAAGGNAYPTRGAGYFNFGGASSMSVDIYTYDREYAAGESGWYPGPGTADGRNRSVIRITYPVTGTFRIGNGRIGSSSAGWHNYGPIIMENMRNGEITIELPCSTSASGGNYVYFNPDT